MRPCLFHLLSLLILLALTASGCDDSGGGSEADAAGQVGRRDMGPRVVADAQLDMGPPSCRINSDCDPGFYCDPDERICIFDCRVDRDCAMGLTCQSGQCLPPQAECATDEDCGPPGRICNEGVCTPGCGVTGCGADLRCEAATGRCVPEDPTDDCRQGARCPDGWTCDPASGQCEPPSEDCRDGAQCPNGTECSQATGRCVPSNPDQCGECPDGWMCNPDTNRCEPPGPPPMGLFGEDCQADADCQSGLCLQVEVSGRPFQICSQLCCTATQCPPNSGCLYLRGVKYCVPSTIFPAGFDFTAGANQSCGPTGNSCRSGLCNRNRDRCIQGCCTDADCGGLACSWALAGNSQRTICDIPLGFGRTGQPCQAEFDCQSNICIVTGGNPPAQCADTCCSNNDCPGDMRCGQVLSGADNVSLVTACVPAVRGVIPLGEACVADEACQTGLCAGEICSDPCCSDVHCPGGQICAPRSNGQVGEVRVCVPRPE